MIGCAARRSFSKRGNVHQKAASHKRGRRTCVRPGICTDGAGEERGGTLLVAVLARRLTTGRRETSSGVLFFLVIWAGRVRRPHWRRGRPVTITRRRARCDAARRRRAGVHGGAAVTAWAGDAGGSRPRVGTHEAPRPRVFGWVRANPDGRREWGGSTAMACGCGRVALDVEAGVRAV